MASCPPRRVTAALQRRFCYEDLQHVCKYRKENYCHSLLGLAYLFVLLLNIECRTLLEQNCQFKSFHKLFETTYIVLDILFICIVEV